MNLLQGFRQTVGKAFRFTGKGLSTKEKWRVSLPGPILSIGGVLIHNVFIKFYTDIIGLSPAYVGWVYVIYNIWNAINDPVFGVWIDKMRGRPGRSKYLYLMRVTVPLMMLSAFLMILSSPSWSQWLIFLVYTVELFVYDTAATAYSIAYASYIQLAAPTKEERVDVNIITNYISQAMSFVITLIPTLLLVGNARREIIIPVFSAVILAESVFFFFALRKLPKVPDQLPAAQASAFSRREILKESWAVIKSRAFISYILYTVIALGPVRFYFTPFLYYMDHVAKVDGTVATLIDLSCHVFVLLFLPFMGRVAQNLGTKRSVYRGMIPAALGYGILFFAKHLLLIWVGYILLVFTVNYFATVTSPMPGLLIDWNEQETGVRKTGLFNGLFALFGTALAGLQTVIFTSTIGAFGYDGTLQTQPDSAAMGIRIATALIPLAAILLGLIPMKLYPFGKQEEEEISAFNKSARKADAARLEEAAT